MHFFKATTLTIFIKHLEFNYWQSSVFENMLDQSIASLRMRILFHSESNTRVLSLVMVPGSVVIYLV